MKSLLNDNPELMDELEAKIREAINPTPATPEQLEEEAAMA